jgi:hypothetical protein
MWFDDRREVEVPSEDRLECRRDSGALGAPASWSWAGYPFVIRRSDSAAYAGATFTGRAFDEMSDRDRRNGSGKDRMRRPSPLDAGFDRWLNRRLHELYDPVLEEPVPDTITSLLEGFDRKPEAGNGKDEPRDEG